VIELTPDLEAASFDGRVDIEVEVAEAVESLVLNAAELDISSARVTTPDGRVTEATVEADEDSEQVTLHLPSPLPPGPAVVGMTFTGILNDHLHGFYRSTFVDAEGATRVIATTQFESTDARRAFPCWDEPDFKATFAVTLVVPPDLTALSSGAEVTDTVVEGGRRRVEFAETMRMSTYVLAWVVGPFELTAPVDVDGVTLRLAAPPGRAALTPFGLEAAAHSLRYFSDYFGIPYPSDKIDHVAIPDFAFGAMENLGCVTYRETALLADGDRSSQLELMRVAQVVAHETAHMWFGDLVTMKWWNGIWLNEAFATFMELKASEHFRPDWHVWTAFGAGKAAALVVDGLDATRSVEIEVGAPEEAEAMFDVLTYQKGGSVLRMLEQYLGEEVFRLGIGRYLRRHAYANTETSDLWDALEAESGEPVRATMDSWILQGGHPLVRVSTTEDATGVVLSQQRFLYRGESDDRWVVPVNLRASVDGEIVHRRVLLDDDVTVDLGGALDWVVVNEGGWGFYRTEYSPDLLGRLTTAGLQAICTPLERSGLVGDTWAGVMRGAIDLGAWLALLAAIGDETDPDVWSVVVAPFRLLERIASEAEVATVAATVRRLAGPAFARLGWDAAPGQSERDAITRSRLISALGTIGADPEVRAEAAARLERYATDSAALDPDILTATVGVVAATGAPGTYDRLRQLYRTAATPQDEQRYQTALGALPDPEDLRRTLDLTLTPEVRSQDGPFMVATVLMNRNSGAAAWSWIEDNWDRLAARFPRNLLVRLFEGLVGFVDDATVARVHAFLGATDVPRGPRLAQIEERLDINVAFADRVRSGLAETLETS
jgi:puromycin-sensitive aminopeptidase